MAKSLIEATQKRAEVADQITKKTSKQINKSQEPIERQTYYVPREKHRRLKMLAIQKNVNVSDLAVEGIDYVLEKYES